jgi:hypothetical protein
MCRICAEVLDKLIQKGLVSKGNVLMCLDEIDKDIEKILLNTNQTELDMIIRHSKTRGKYDA